MFLTIRHLPDNFRRDFNSLCEDSERLEFISDIHKHNQMIRVANIEFTDEIQNPLEAAFAVTNTLQDPWYENGCIEVEASARKGCRSTSVGDIIQKNGVSYMVANYGFLEIK